MEEFTRKVYHEWKIGRILSEDEYLKLVSDTHSRLVKEAKAGNILFYKDLETFNELKERGFKGKALSVIIGQIVGACSEYEAERRRPLLSSIVRSMETGAPGLGFYGLPKVPSFLRKQNWEDKGIKPPEIVIRKRQEFWLSELQRVLKFYKKHDPI